MNQNLTLAHKQAYKLIDKLNMNKEIGFPDMYILLMYIENAQKEVQCIEQKQADIQNKLNRKISKVW